MIYVYVFSDSLSEMLEDYIRCVSDLGYCLSASEV